MTIKEDFIQAFIWMDANVETIKSRIQRGDLAAKLVTDNFALACQFPTNRMIVQTFTLSLSTLKGYGGDWSNKTVSAKREAEIRLAIDGLGLTF